MLVMFVQELLDKCHPLGMFDSIATLAVASSMRELYRLVLVDTPLAPYFSESLSAGESSFPRALPLVHFRKSLEQWLLLGPLMEC